MGRFGNKTTEATQTTVCAGTPTSSRSSPSINALRACVYIYIRQLSSFRAPTLWFIHVTVATCHIQYTFLSLCRFLFFKRKRTKHENTRSPPFSLRYENGHRRLLGAQSINTERTALGCILLGLFRNRNSWNDQKILPFRASVDYRHVKTS